MEQTNNTLSFIQLTKSILEYYGTTKKVKQKEINKDFANELDEAESMIENFDKSNFFDDLDVNNIFVEVPNEVDEEVKKTFLSQLKLYQTQKEKNKEGSEGTLLG
tara:strand:+ start:501 stop:815 length:315 start_codon:yes stop_codon:yes gene_type:complete